DPIATEPAGDSHSDEPGPDHVGLQSQSSRFRLDRLGHDASRDGNDRDAVIDIPDIDHGALDVHDRIDAIPDARAITVVLGGGDVARVLDRRRGGASPATLPHFQEVGTGEAQSEFLAEAVERRQEAVLTGRLTQTMPSKRPTPTALRVGAGRLSSGI